MAGCNSGTDPVCLIWGHRIDLAWNGKVSVRDYMLGYYDMKTPEVKGIHRLLAKIADKWLGMKIIKIQFK